MSDWMEVADRVYHRRYDPFDVSICVVRGGDGLLLVDTRSSHREGRRLQEDLAVFGSPVRWVVNTHAHFDHTFGNAVFGGPPGDVPIYGHRLVPSHLAEHEAVMLEEWVAGGNGPVDGLEEVRITPPDQLVGDMSAMDVGDRAVLMLHLGRGHTDGDLVLHVPDAGCWVVGDLLEESGPPAYGSDSFPLEWPDTLATLLDRVGDDDTLVPGHGRALGRPFAEQQRADVRAVAELITELHDAGVDAGDALRAGGGRWPFPAHGLAEAVRLGYEALDHRRGGVESPEEAERP
ncbi:MAG TPA: MBL fold metallo-hydrolase [Actinomycetales bacterium]|nr:MBL fold metallo-hydrolase [Actinomycetales bacterium]